MKDERKTKQQLINELAGLRQRVAELEASEKERVRAEDGQRKALAEALQATHALRESEERYRTLFERANDAIVLAREDDTIVDVNRRACEMLGYTHEELLTMKVPDLQAPEVRGQEGSVIRQELEYGSTPFESVDIRRDGTRIPVEVSTSRVTKELALCIVRDITERVRAEEALRQSEEKYRTILETVEDSYFEVDIAGNFTFFNDSLCRLLGYPEDELMGMNNREYMDNENARKVYQTFNVVYRTGEPAEIFDWEVIRKDGARRFVESSVSLMRDSAGEPAGFRGVVRDITERKRAEEALRESEERLRHILDSLQIGVAIIDAETHVIVDVNPVAVEMIGAPKEQIVGQVCHRFICPAEMGQCPITDLGQAIDKSERVLINATGEDTPILKSVTPIILDGREHLIDSFIDITERKRAEEALERRAVQMATLNRIGHQVASILDQQELLQQSVDAVREDLAYLQAAVLLVGEEANALYVAAATDNFWEIIPDGYRQPVGKGAIGTAAQTGKTVLVKDASSDTRVYRVGEWFSPSSLSMPIKIGKRVIGVLEVEADVPNAFDENDQAALETMADQIAIAIENAGLYADIEQRQMYLEGVLNAAPDAIVTLDAQHRIVEWNPGAEKLFGYSQEEVIGQDIDDLVTSPEVLREALEFTQVAMGGMEVPPTETVRYRKDGSPVDVIVAGSPILVGDEFIGAVAVYTDITERVRMEETLRAMALLDELTGLYNRRGFSVLAEHQLKMAARGNRRMMLLFADFNGLKRINDTFGHHEGDRALVETADVLEETFRESDIVARIGGDEFVVLAIETNGSPAEVLTTRLRENLEARNAKADRRYELSLSVGIAHYDPVQPCSLDDLLARADRAMYEQKRCEQES